MSSIVFDLGGTFLRCAISDKHGTLRKFTKQRIENCMEGHSPEFVWGKILAAMSSFVSGIQNQIAEHDPVVFAFPGPIENGRRILQAPTISGGDTAIPDLRAELAAKTRRSVHILNDVSAAAWYFSEQLAINRFIVVTVSSGIGSKIFDREHPLGVLDSVPYAGEIGHLVVDEGEDAPICDCGGKGHLGGIASGRGIERYARTLARSEPAAFEQSACVRTFNATIETLNNESHLVPAAKSRDEWALDVIRTSTRPLAHALNAVCLAAGLQGVIIIGGFPLALGEVYIETLRHLMNKECDYAMLRDRLPSMIHLAAMDDEACLRGAAAYGRRVLGSAR